MRDRFTFGLGCAHPGQLRSYRGPAFVALPCLRDARALPEPAAEVDWVGVDSGGYVAMMKHGGWPWNVEVRISETCTSRVAHRGRH